MPLGSIGGWWGTPDGAQPPAVWTGVCVLLAGAVAQLVVARRRAAAADAAQIRRRCQECGAPVAVWSGACPLCHGPHLGAQ